MKKKIILGVALFLMLLTLFALSISASEPIKTWDISATENDNVTATLYNDYSLVISGTGEMGNWTSYSSVPWYSSYASRIIAATIEDGVTNIGHSAFWCCSNLAKISIPDSVTYIGSNAFYECAALTSVSIPSSVVTINYRAFRECSSLSSIILQEGLSSIGSGAFSSCKKLTEIKLPDSVETIGSEAFYSCEKLKKLHLGNCLTTIGSSAFSGCFALTEIDFPNSLLSIESYAFFNCYNLANATFGNSLATIGSNAFYSCKSLTYINLPDSVTSIGSYAFAYCREAKELKIGKGVVYFGEGAFKDCTAVEKLYYDAIKADALGYENHVFSNVGDEASGVSVVIGAEVTVIPAHMFCPDVYGNSYSPKIQSLVFEEGSNCEIIETRAFAMINSLKSVIIPDSVTAIEYIAFGSCTGLSSIVIPKSVTSMSFQVFYGCSSLTIYCEAESKPSGWNSDWNTSSRPVVWDYKNTLRAQVFTFKGYSFNESGSMAVGFDIDYEAKALHEELTGENLEIGVVFAAYDLLLGQQPLDSQGNAITLNDGAVVKFDLTEYDYTYYDFIVTHIIDSIKDIPLVISAYINNGYENKYIQDDGIRDTVIGISYNEAQK